MATKKAKKVTVKGDLKNDVEYLALASTSAPTAKERAWARRQLKRIRSKK